MQGGGKLAQNMKRCTGKRISDSALSQRRKVLGMEVVIFAGGRKALSFGNQKLNLHQAGKEFEPKALAPTAGSADLCFIAATPLAQVTAHLHDCGILKHLVQWIIGKAHLLLLI